MTRRPQKSRRPAEGRGKNHSHANDTPRKPWEGLKLPTDWRDRLPKSVIYYRVRVPKLGKANATGWAQGPCPFHEDRNASLSVNVREGHGGWRCFAGCGHGDLVAFEMRLTGKAFDHAVAALVGMRV